MPNVIDMFAGAGGLSLGASRAGFNVVSAVEIDVNASRSHTANFPNTIHIQDDITNISSETLLRISNIRNDQLTGIIGGPPCQGFSSIGRGDAADARNQLFIRFFKFVNELQPSFFLVENVPGIMSSKYASILDTAMSYVTEYNVLLPYSANASDFGAPTNRTRVFFIGYKEHSGINQITLDDFENMKVSHQQKTNVQQALEGLPEDIRYSKNNSGERKLSAQYSDPQNEHIQSELFFQNVVANRPQGLGDQQYITRYAERSIVNGCYVTNHSPDVRRRYSRLKYGQQDNISKSVRLNPNGLCPTIRAGTGPDKGSFQAVRPIHYKYSRVITPREAARLQGFPDWYKLPETIWHGFRQIGNSVSPIVAERLLCAIYQKLT